MAHLPELPPLGEARREVSVFLETGKKKIFHKTLCLASCHFIFALLYV